MSRWQEWNGRSSCAARPLFFLTPYPPASERFLIWFLKCRTLPRIRSAPRGSHPLAQLMTGGQSGVSMLLLHYTGMTSLEDVCAASVLARGARSRRTTWSHEDGGRGSIESPRRGARGTQAYRHGRARPRLISARSASKSSIPGITLGYPDFPDAQVKAVIALCRDIIARHRIPADRVLGHSDVAPSRKQDPGEKFPWQRLHEAGVGHWVAPAPLVRGSDPGVRQPRCGRPRPAASARALRLRRPPATGCFDDTHAGTWWSHFSAISVPRASMELPTCRPGRTLSALIAARDGRPARTQSE